MKSLHISTVAILVLGAGVLVGCGSDGPDGTQLSCGAGTHEEGGQCVPDTDGGAADAMNGPEGGDGAPEASDDRAPCEKSGNCPQVQMVTVTKWPEGVDGKPYQIDPHEATNAEYALFLEDAKNGFVPAQTDEKCAWNDSFEQGASCIKTTAVGVEGARLEDPAFPAICLDWCDAAAFCTWQGKRLCTSHPFADDYLNYDWTRAEWTNACSAGEGMGPSKFECGMCTWDAPCEDQPGVFNLSGGVEEWVDYCTQDGATGSWACLTSAGRLGKCPGCWGDTAEPIHVKTSAGVRCCRSIDDGR